MMSMQARESFPPVASRRHPLRAYAANSPRAKARLLVLALLADGRLDEREMAALDRRGVFADLGIAREDFIQVMYDFCGDVAGQLPAGVRGYQLTPRTLAGLFSEVDDRKAREKLLQHIVAVISSDGCLSDDEESLFRVAIDQWQPHAGSVQRTVFPGLHYGWTMR